MNLIHNLIHSTGWFSTIDPTLDHSNGEQVQETEKVMDPAADKVKNELVDNGYNQAVDAIIEKEYPLLRGKLQNRGHQVERQ